MLIMLVAILLASSISIFAADDVVPPQFQVDSSAQIESLFFGDRIQIQHGKTKYVRTVYGIPGQRILPIKDADFSKRFSSTWDFFSTAEAGEDTVIFLSSPIPTSDIFTTSDLPSEKTVVLSMSFREYLTKAVMPDSTFYLKQEAEYGTPVGAKEGVTWGTVKLTDTNFLGKLVPSD